FGHFGRFAFSSNGKSLAWTSTLVFPRYGGSWFETWDLAAGKGSFGDRLGSGGDAPALSPDGSHLATTRPLHFWDLSKSKKAWGSDEVYLDAVAFSPDGKVLAGGDWVGVVHLFDAAAGGERRKLVGHRHTITALAFSTDGKRLASGDSRGGV